MASWLSFTNHKLYQSRLLCQQAGLKPEPAALADALSDAALHILHDAYLSYLHELAELATYRQPVSSLAELLQETPLVTGEMRELQHLEEDSFSWLAAMLSAVSALSSADRAGRQSAQAVELSSSSMINLIDQSDADVTVWHGRLSQLIDLQRENRQES